MIRQLPLELPHQASLVRADFLVSEANREAVALVDGWPEWPPGTVVLVGPAGSGKTHLVEIWRAASGARVIDAAQLDGTPVDDLLTNGAVVVEDLHHQPFREGALFHLMNRVRETGAFALLTTRTPPAELEIRLADLKSRLVTARSLEIGEPDDDLIRKVLAKQFADRQLKVTPAVVEFIIRRMERSLETARRTVAELDRRALSEARAVTRPLAAAVMVDLADRERENGE
jgi:chromosomal replication initiation ATPase DnaA